MSEVKSLSHVRLVATPWTVAYQAPPFMGFSRQEYWSGLPLPSPGDFPDPGIEPRSPALRVDALPSEPPGKFPKDLWPMLRVDFNPEGMRKPLKGFDQRNDWDYQKLTL